MTSYQQYYLLEEIFRREQPDEKFFFRAEHSQSDTYRALLKMQKVGLITMEEDITVEDFVIMKSVKITDTGLEWMLKFIKSSRIMN